MSAASDRVSKAIDNLAAKGKARSDAHAAHDLADREFAAAQSELTAAQSDLAVEAAQISSDSEKPSQVQAPAGLPVVAEV